MATLHPWKEPSRNKIYWCHCKLAGSFWIKQLLIIICLHIHFYPLSWKRLKLQDVEIMNFSEANNLLNVDTYQYEIEDTSWKVHLSKTEDQSNGETKHNRFRIFSLTSTMYIVEKEKNLIFIFYPFTVCQICCCFCALV